jgi:hypothetical protein
MLSDHKQAEAYALVTDALEDLNSWLNVIEAMFIEDDWDMVKKIGQKLGAAQDVLEA